MFPRSYNYHINATFHPPELAVPIMVEIQLWCTKIMAHNDLSHWAYAPPRFASSTRVDARCSQVRARARQDARGRLERSTGATQYQ